MKVIGLTGTIGAGKDTLKEILKRKFNCYYISLSNIIRAEIEKKRNTLNRKTLQDMGNEMRKKYGTHILAKLAIDYLQKDKKMIIIDGIKNPGEVEYLRKQFGKNFILIAVDAPKELRFQSILKRGTFKDPKSMEEFTEMDDRDLGINEPEWGQQTRKCIEQADFVVVNDGSVEDFQVKVGEVISKI